MRGLSILLAAALGLSAPAGAAWHQASTTHFVIYSDDSPNRLRDFAVHLEEFDSAVRHARAMDVVPPGPGNRLTVFVLRDRDQIARLAGRE